MLICRYVLIGNGSVRRLQWPISSFGNTVCFFTQKLSPDSSAPLLRRSVIAVSLLVY